MLTQIQNKNNKAMIINSNNAESYNILNNAKYYYDKLFGLSVGNISLFIIIALIIMIIVAIICIINILVTKTTIPDMILLIIIIVTAIVNIILLFIVLSLLNNISVYLHENILLNDFNYTQIINNKKSIIEILLIVCLIMLIFSDTSSDKNDDDTQQKKAKMSISSIIAIIIYFIYSILMIVYSSILIHSIKHITNMNKDAYLKQEAYKINKNSNTDYSLYIYMNGQEVPLIKQYSIQY